MSPPFWPIPFASASLATVSVFTFSFDPSSGSCFLTFAISAFKRFLFSFKFSIFVFWYPDGTDPSFGFSKAWICLDISLRWFTKSSYRLRGVVLSLTISSDANCFSVEWVLVLLYKRMSASKSPKVSPTYSLFTFFSNWPVFLLKNTVLSEGTSSRVK